MVWFMSKRLIGSPEEISGDAALHIDLAVLLVPLLFLKVIIARKYKSYHSILMPLGLSIFVISVVLVLIRVLPYALGKINPSSSIAKYSLALIVLFCVSMARLALRPLRSSSTKTPSLSSSFQSVSKPRSNTFALELVRSEVQTPDAKTLCFRVQDDKKVARSYSICSSPLKTDYIEITPKCRENGYVSVFLNERATPGLIIKASGPAGQFYFDEKLHTELVLIAAGSGITPMIAILRYIEELSLTVPVTLIYCVRTRGDIIFRKELIRLSCSLARFRIAVTLTAPDPGWKGQKGRVNKEFLLERVSDFRAPTFFLCGPGPFMQHVSELLKEQGVSADRVKQESFGGKPSVAIPDSSGDSSVAFVEFSRSGFEFELIPDMTLLEFAETVGVSIPYSCRQGQCGTCATRLLEGSVSMQAESGLSSEQK